MKKIWIIALCLFGLTISSKGQDIVADFLKKQTNPNVFTQVNISAKMFQLVADITDSETEGIIQDLTGMRILTVDQESEACFNQAKQLLEKQTSEYETLMNIKEEQEEVWMYIREVKGQIAELVILVGDGGEFVLMNFMGKIDLKKMSRLTKSVNVNGIKYLNKVKDAPSKKVKNN